MESESEYQGGMAQDNIKVSAIEAITSVRAHDGGVYASKDVLFQNAIFGRDSIETAQDCMAFDPKITQEVIISLAQLQGTDKNLDTEEEPGRIHHEFRSLFVNDEKVSDESQAIITSLAEKKWGTPEKIHYFGTIDATPLYVGLVMDYVARNGSENLDTAFLDRQIVQKNGEVKTIRESVYAGLSWIENRMTQSPLGLVEFKRTNPQGVENQVWKDSDTSYIHTSGVIANHEEPIAPIEVQGYAYDALIKASKLLGSDEDKKRWQQGAMSLQNALDQLWIPDEQFFAMGIDRDDEKNPRLIQTISTNPALLLNTQIFDTMPEDKKNVYVEGIIRKIIGSNFLTDVGIRTRDVKYAQLIPHPYKPGEFLSDYHGSETSWIKETYDIAKGLDYQGFHRLAEQLENRILNAVSISGKFYEFYYVDKEGNVNYDPHDTIESSDERKKLAGTNIPEGSQAWTIAAVLDIKHKRGQKQSFVRDQNSPHYKLEEELLEQMPNIAVLSHLEEIPKPPIPFIIEKVHAPVSV